MDQNNKVNLNSAALNSDSCLSDSTPDTFDMKTCEKTLPNLHPSEDSVNNECSDDEYCDAKDACDSDELDDEALKEKYENLSNEALEELKIEAALFKNDGNECFKDHKYAEAITLYTTGLNTCPLKYPKNRAILYANRAAAKINLDKKEEAVLDCNKAIDLDPDYLKAVLRRAQLYRQLDNLEKSLEDYRKVLELDKNNMEARGACATLPPEIEEKNEKLKTEMFGKLKELGNLCLRPFGLSTENFKVVQDPQSGGYSVNFQNNS